MDPKQGGPSQGLRNLIPELEKLGIHNDVVSLDDPGSSFLGGDSFQIHALGPPKTPWSFTSKLLPWLSERLPEYDAVIVHGLWLYHGYAVKKALGRLPGSAGSGGEARKPRLFVMPHGMLDPYFQRDPSRRMKALRNSFYWRAVEQRVINQADGVLFTCEEELRLARESFPGYRPRAEINVGYGVAAPPVSTDRMRSEFLKTCPGIGARSYLLFLSRIHVKKGVDLLIQAYVELLQERLTGSGSGTEAGEFPALVIAGPLDSDYAREMRNHARDLLSRITAKGDGPKQEDFIHFPGMLQGDAKWGAFYGCDAFVLPSHQENFGISVVEALACGKPVLISNKVNIWREIEEMNAGLVSTDDLSGVRKQLGDFLELQKAGNGFGDNPGNCYQMKFGVSEAANGFARGLRTAGIPQRL